MMINFSKLEILALVAIAVAAQPVAAACRVAQAAACDKDVLPAGLQVDADAIPLAEPGTLTLLGASTVAAAMLARVKRKQKRRAGNQGHES